MELIKRAWAHTVWAEGAIPDSEGQLAKDVRRILLPVFDVWLIVTALLAIRGGMPTFEIVYNTTVSTVVAWGLLVTAVLCLIGVCFPKLEAVEVISKLGLFMILFGYGLSLLLYSAEDSARGFVGGAMVAVCFIPVGRILNIGRTYRRRRGKK